MASRATTTNDETVTGLGSIEVSMAFLEQQPWWPAFREGRRTCVRMIDDVLWVGHFCAWCQRQHVAIQQCTRTDLDAYAATIASFRPGPRFACQRTISALIEFLATTRAPDGDRSTVEIC